MRKFLNLFLITVSSILFICSCLYILKYFFDVWQTKKQSNLLNELSFTENITNNIDNEKQSEIIIGKVKTERMLKLEKLQLENSDIIGWIEIENTNINYPVLQGEDNSYYMNHNYKKQKSANGSIFLDKDYNFDLPSSNLLLYGHNMKNGTMFQHLLKYRDKTFYISHPVIRFTTNNEDVNYEIISVFESRVYYKSEKNVFRYYYFINAENEGQYNEYVTNAKNASLYDTGKSAKYGEQLLTLSTCSYHTKNGRFVLVAKKGLE